MQRLVIAAAILAATWTSPALAGWYSFGPSNTCCGTGCGHGFAHQLHSMSPEQLWAGYCQEQANRHCRHGQGCGCGACGLGACGCGTACGAGVGQGHWRGLPGPSACGGNELGCGTSCASGCTGASLAPAEPGSTGVAEAEYGDHDHEHGDHEHDDHGVEFDAVQSAE